MTGTGLYNGILINPAMKGSNKLYILSGYASATMAGKHLYDLSDKHLLSNLSVELIIGMAPFDGITQNNHKGFNMLMKNRPLKVSYVCNKPIHSKLYIWMENSIPKYAFTGSANYTQTAFNGIQGEYMSKCDPVEAYKYYKTITNTVYADYNDIEKYILLKKDSKQIDRDLQLKDKKNIVDSNKIHVSLLNSKGKIGSASGLNWGQREGRNRNQAYIPLSKEVYKSNFFPPKGTYFMVVTDDDKLFICTRAQKNYGNDIETPTNNALLGEYFRRRLHIANGAFIREEDLINYGRSYVEFTKLDDEDYYMDFSQKRD